VNESYVSEPMFGGSDSVRFGDPVGTIGVLDIELDSEVVATVQPRLLRQWARLIEFSHHERGGVPVHRLVGEDGTDPGLAVPTPDGNGWIVVCGYAGDSEGGADD